MRKSSPVDAVLILQVALLSDDAKAATVAGTEEAEMKRVLLNRLETIEVALQKVAELQCGSSHTPTD